MKSVSFFKINLLFVFVALICCLPKLQGHDNLTIHPLLMDRAYEAWVNKNTFFTGIGASATTKFNYDMPLGETPPSLDPNNRGIFTSIGIDLPPSRPWTLKEWLIAGAIDEDAPHQRCLEHFYNPLDTHHGLSDPQLVLNIAGLANAPDSYAWATTGQSQLVGDNQESWHKARSYLFDSLTKAASADRASNSAHTFYALGKVSHLLQDLSQPEHVRNDAHIINADDTPMVGGLWGVVPRARWIENYGYDHILDIKNWDLSVPALDWRAANFTRVQDFWNRSKYTQANANALDDDASGYPAKALGLAEFINGNFVGADASYAELVSNANHHFPHPALSDTNYATFGVSGAPMLASTWTSSAKTNPVNGAIRKSIFLRKDHSGVVVEKHAVLNYSLLFRLRLTGFAQDYPEYPAITINAPDVLEQYHKIILPKAIAYSAGLLDYFFRGRLYAYCSYDEQTQSYQVSVYNASGLPLKGGAFTIYWDDANGNRTAYTGVTSTYNAADGLSAYDWVDFTIPVPAGAAVDATKAMIVFQGTIGNTGDDPDDEGKAIAAAQIDLPVIPIPQPQILAATVSASKLKCGVVDYAHGSPPKAYLKLTGCSGYHKLVSTWAINSDTGGCVQTDDTPTCDPYCSSLIGAFFINPVDGKKYRKKTTTTTTVYKYGTPPSDDSSPCHCDEDAGPDTTAGTAVQIDTQEWVAADYPSCFTLQNTYGGNAHTTCTQSSELSGSCSITTTCTRNSDGSWHYRTVLTGGGCGCDSHPCDFEGDSSGPIIPQCYYGGAIVTVEDVYEGEIVTPSTAYPIYENEDTTAALIARAIAALPSYPSFTVGPPASAYTLAANELSFTVERSKYKFRFRAALVGAGERYQLAWVERTLPSSGAGITSLEIAANGVYRPKITVDAPVSGSTAKLQAVMAANGSVDSVTILDPGSGYTSAPAITFDNPYGAGVRTTVTAVIDSNPMSATYGQITSITLNAAGNYLPTISISVPGSPGTPATATCTLKADGTLATVSLSTGGSGYTGSPSVNISGQAGTGGAVILPHLGTETPKTWTWDGNKPSGYSASDPTTWPVSPVYELKEPSSNGKTTVANVIATITATP